MTQQTEADSGTRKKRILRQLLVYGTPAAASALMLTLALPGYEQWYLSFVALVPLLVVLQQAPGKRGVFVAWIAGFLFFFAAMAWLRPLTLVGWGALAFYLSLSFLLFAVVVRFLSQGNMRLPFIAVVPVVWIALELPSAASMHTIIPSLFS